MSDSNEKSTNTTTSCFVMIGYGTRTYLTSKKKTRKINLERTYSDIIEKTFNELNGEGYNVSCFRSIDTNKGKTGLIDKQMYEDIYESDLVIADISTLNGNVMYELGIRHALKPKTTIVICESMTELPFDVNHVIVDFYECEKNGILYHVQKDFTSKLKFKIRSILDSKEIKNDSPVHQYLDGLSVNRMKRTSSINEIEKNDHTLAELIEAAESAKQKMDFSRAIELIQQALEIDPNDSFLLQRQVLFTYKSKLPSEEEALERAETLLRDNLQSFDSIDSETFGLSGAVNKRLSELKNSIEHLNKALHYYSKGYYLLNDYYNGINAAFQYTIRAAKFQEDFEEAKLDFDIGNRIRNEVKEICSSLIDTDDFDQRTDCSWIFLTLAEVYFMEQDTEAENQMIQNAREAEKGTFDLTSYEDQKKKLSEAMKIVAQKLRIKRFNV